MGKPIHKQSVSVVEIAAGTPESYGEKGGVEAGIVHCARGVRESVCDQRLQIRAVKSGGAANAWR